MPQNHHYRRPDGNDTGVAVQNNQQFNNGDDEVVLNPRFRLCCVPHGCHRLKEDPIDTSDPGDSVKVVCNNESCNMGQWMHSDCFAEWEQHVLSYLRSCGRARSWSEKQRLQNLWTKKGYDLAYKACDCKCGKGHIRKDNDYIPPRQSAKQRRHKKKAEKALPSLHVQQKAGIHGSGNAVPATPPAQPQILQHGNPLPHFVINQNTGSRPPLRVRTSSFSSTGSSPPSSAETPPLTPGGGSGMGKKSKFEFFADAEQAAAGNIFKRRTDFSAFNILPRHQQNPYHIKMEDEGPHGNDETRCFVLSNLSTHQVTTVKCVCCLMDMPVYDRYPLIDGTFFLSPQRYQSDLQVLSDHKLLYLNAICMRCMEGARGDIRCIACRKRWDGSTFILGTMYSYDIFAAVPCCAFRTTCKNCRRPIIDPGTTFNFYSEYSRPIQCPHCRAQDYHFVKPIEECFQMKNSICKF